VEGRDNACPSSNKGGFTTRLSAHADPLPQSTPACYAGSLVRKSPSTPTASQVLTLIVPLRQKLEDQGIATPRKIFGNGNHSNTMVRKAAKQNAQRCTPQVEWRAQRVVVNAYSSARLPAQVGRRSRVLTVSFLGLTSHIWKPGIHRISPDLTILAPTISVRRVWGVEICHVSVGRRRGHHIYVIMFNCARSRDQRQTRRFEFASQRRARRGIECWRGGGSIGETILAWKPPIPDCRYPEADSRDMAAQ